MLTHPQASRVLTFQTMEGLVLLAGIIPLLNMLLQKRFHMPSTKVDQLITRSSFALLSVGALVMGISQTWFLYTIGMSTPHVTIGSLLTLKRKE